MGNKEITQISPSVLESVKNDLAIKHPKLIVEGLLNPSLRDELREIVKREHKSVVKENETLIDYVVQETVGTGVIEEIINSDDSITDIGYNGTNLVIQSNDYKKLYEGNTEVTDEYIVRIIQKFANAVGKEFTPKQPILNAVYGNVRLNAVHNTKNPSGKTTMSMRIVRPRLALNVENFNTYAPNIILDFMAKAIQLKSNVVINGESGTGKTELHKLLLSFVDFEDKVIMIEDVPESFATELFPEKDIYNWVTNGTSTINDFVKAANRHNPSWVMVTETVGEEAFELYSAILSGIRVITSLHSIDNRAVPNRFVSMAKMGYSVDEKMMTEDLRRYLGYGIHNKKVKIDGKVIRYLSEIVAYDVNGDKTVFEQTIEEDKFICTFYEYPKQFKEDLVSLGIDISHLLESENKEITRKIIM